jgi:hypothetical protein
MARNRQIGPAARSAPVARIAPLSPAQEQAEYRAMLTDELGPPVFNRKPARDDGRPVGLIRLMLRPAGLFGLALLALFAVTIVKLWREGVFESFRVKGFVSNPPADKGWMLGDKVRLPPEKNDTVVRVEPIQATEAEQSADGAEADSAE